jgi:hypothetical protein
MRLLLGSFTNLRNLDVFIAKNNAENQICLSGHFNIPLYHLFQPGEAKDFFMWTRDSSV